MRRTVLCLILSTMPFLAGAGSSRLSAQGIKTTFEALRQLAASSPETISCVYRAYPAPSPLNKQHSKSANGNVRHSAPKGYQPVFLSHYGRHGSRFLTDDERYISLIELFESHPLTPAGMEVLRRLAICYEQARGRGGDLTPLGEEQHRGIAERMFRLHTQLFGSTTTLNVYASTSRRCMMSMMAFCERLKELNPRLTLTRDVCEGNMDMITCSMPQQKTLLKDTTLASCKAFKAFCQKHEHTSAFFARLFQQPDSVTRQYYWMEQFYLLAQDMQDCGRPTELLSFMTPDEIYSVWNIKNCGMYLANGDSPLSGDIPARCADSLLDHIIGDADKAIHEGRGGATLRFGHDTALLRLLSRMGVTECCPSSSDMDTLPLVWQDYNISPMAANLQIIFYQNKQGDVLAQFLLNENEVHLPLPAVNNSFYRWKEIKELWKTRKQTSVGQYVPCSSRQQ